MSVDDTPPGSKLARRLVDAHRRRATLDDLGSDEVPPDLEAAFDAQHRSLDMLAQPIAGWKVGSKSVDGPIQGAPLPADRRLSSGVTLRRADYAVLGLELEVAFQFNRRFEPFSGPHADDVVLAALGMMQATIEIVSSRYAGWPAVDKLAQLADLQNHGALVCGEAVPYDPAYPFTNPRVNFGFNGLDVINGPVGNPAGDPRRLLSWIVNHCVSRGIAIGDDVAITTGSYTGMYFPTEPGTAVGLLAGFPPVRLTLA